jgi:Holliday junction DNA helicase RuvA
MIGRMHGILLEKKPPQLLLDIGGVGYEISAPMTTFYKLPEINETITLHTHLVVREDAHQLYGFFHQEDRELFRALIKVNGVGPKLGLTILSGMDANHFVHCINTGDISTLVNVPGIGKKTAERLIIETKDALSKWKPQSDGHASDLPSTAIAESHETQDAISALTTLGYKPADAKKTVNTISEPGYTSQQLIRLALQHMMKGARS